MDGLWENYRVEEVATPEAWQRDPALVLRFYNQRRKQLMQAQPNAGHLAIAQLANDFDVEVITQNVDNLHERAGSTKVLHLHGELMKARSTADPFLVYELDHWALDLGDVCEKGSQLRPHIVWFGEAVPEMPRAIKKVEQADILVVVGTSLAVYPAAALVNYAPAGTPIFVVDPARPEISAQNVCYIQEKAGPGMQCLRSKLEKLM